MLLLGDFQIPYLQSAFDDFIISHICLKIAFSLPSREYYILILITVIKTWGAAFELSIIAIQESKLKAPASWQPDLLICLKRWHAQHRIQKVQKDFQCTCVSFPALCCPPDPLPGGKHLYRFLTRDNCVQAYGLYIILFYKMVMKYTYGGNLVFYCKTFKNCD